MTLTNWWYGAALAAICLTAGCAAMEAPPQVPSAGASVRAARQMVVAANPLAAAAGLDILRRGGGAIDAAVAVQMVLTLVEPQSSGLGGGGFLLHYDAGSRDLTSYDGRETAPAAASADMFLRPDGTAMDFDEAVVGGLSVGVPGALRLLELAHRAHGRLPWADLFAPAIELAEEGFPVSPRLHALLADDEHLRRLPAAAAYFYGGDGSPHPVGTTLRNPALADTLRRIAAGGADAFYEGRIAGDIAAAVTRSPLQPGRMSLADLADYAAKERAPVCAPYRLWRVCGMGPPSSGGVAVLQMLRLLERFDLVAAGPDSVEAAHLFAQAGRLAFADRDRYLADPDKVAVPVAQLLDDPYLEERSRLIPSDRDLGKAAPGSFAQQAEWATPPPQPEPVSTSQISILDADGNAVSFTTSIEGAFGSRLFVDGFLLNNQLTDFAFQPERGGRPVANRIEPGKRPRSSMAPTMVFDAEDRLVLVVGSPGGASIIPYVAKTVIAVLDWSLDPQAAVDLPNLGNRNGATELEEGTPLVRIAQALEAMGHEIKLTTMTSGLAAILVTPDGLLGGADRRREGIALGD
ncbi:MAG: gamma-glutamyltransferase [Dongiaceae bacterium]